MDYGLIVGSTRNLGDDIQSLAAKQFLPRIDRFLERDSLNQFKSKNMVKAIMNGWFTHKPDNWPPSPAIDPLFVSFHITPKAANKMLGQKSIEYFKKHEPIGCRDIYTKKLLESKGIKAYFSGCLTTTLDYGYKNLGKRKTDKILLVDVYDDVVDLIRTSSSIMEQSEIISHNYDANIIKHIPHILNRVIKHNTLNKLIFSNLGKLRMKIISLMERLKKAEEQLQRIATAKLVITRRLHAALPAIALGTKVIFIHKDLADPRFKGFLDYLNCYTIPEFKKVFKKFDFENPPENPNQEKLKEMKLNLVKTVEEFMR